MKSKEIVFIFSLIVVISFIFGCIGGNEDSSTEGSKINLSLPNGWENISYDSETINYNYNKTKPSLSLSVFDYKESSDYEYGYNSTIQNSSSWIVNNLSTETINGISVRTVLYSKVDGTEIGKQYYFKKENHFYSVTISLSDENGVTMSQFNQQLSIINEAMNQLVKTITIN